MRVPKPRGATPLTAPVAGGSAVPTLPVALGSGSPGSAGSRPGTELGLGIREAGFSALGAARVFGGRVKYNRSLVSVEGRVILEPVSELNPVTAFPPSGPGAALADVYSRWFPRPGMERAVVEWVRGEASNCPVRGLSGDIPTCRCARCPLTQ